MNTYTLAIMPNGILAAVELDGSDIDAVLTRESVLAGLDLNAVCKLVPGCTLTNDPDATEDYDNVVYTDYQGELLATGFKYAVKRK